MISVNNIDIYTMFCEYVILCTIIINYYLAINKFNISDYYYYFFNKINI